MNRDVNKSSKKQEATEALKSDMTKRRASLTPCEIAFLRGLLLDENTPVSSLTRASKKLSEDMLFSVPFEEPASVKRPSVNKLVQPNQVGLWSAFRDGIRPKALARKGSLILPSNHVVQAEKNSDSEGQLVKENDHDSIASDEEVRPDKPDDQSVSSSLADDDVPPENYDAWEVLKDEYAKDFGYDNTPVSNLQPEDLDKDVTSWVSLG